MLCAICGNPIFQSGKTWYHVGKDYKAEATHDAKPSRVPARETT